MIQSSQKGPQNQPSITMHQVQVRHLIFSWKGIGTYPSASQASTIAAAERKLRGQRNVRVKEVSVSPKK